MKPARLAWIALAWTLVAGIGWGAHPQFPWDVDNIAPGSVLKALAARFGPGWWSSYGPVPYYLVAAVTLPLLAVYRLAGWLGSPTAAYPWGFEHPELTIGALIVAARAVCVALALGMAWLAVRERWAGGRRDAWLVPLLLAGSPTLVYYARTSNVDQFYLFFLAAAFHFAARSGSGRAPVTAGAAAALAVCCKEQSAPLAVVAGALATWNAWRGDGRPRWDRAGAVVAAALLAYVVVWRLPFALEGWREHHRFIFEQARYPRAFAADLLGMAGLARRAAEWAPVALGWPVIVGALLAPLHRDAFRGLGARSLAVAAYAAMFLAVIGYVYPRFLLPVLLLALPLAVRGWSALFDRSGRAAAGVLAALLLLVAAGGPALGLVQAFETRTTATRWIAGHLPPGASVELAGNPRFLPRPPAGHPVISTTLEALRLAPRGPAGDAVLLSGFDRYGFERDSLLRAAWWEPLHAADGGYQQVAQFYPPWWARASRGLPVAPGVQVWVRRGLVR